jgi:tetratricopeptide (TPR) repeat protein
MPESFDPLSDRENRFVARLLSALLLIIVGVQLGRYCETTRPQATQLIEQMLGETPPLPDPKGPGPNQAELLLSAKKKFQAQDFRAARDLFMEILRQSPANFDAHFYLAEIYREMNQPILAAKHSDEIVRINPNHRDSVRTLGNYPKITDSDGQYQPNSATPGQYLFSTQLTYEGLAKANRLRRDRELRLYENYREVGGYGPYASLVTSRGFFLHTATAISFSPADKSDPNQNGRAYFLRIIPVIPIENPDYFEKYRQFDRVIRRSEELLGPGKLPQARELLARFHKIYPEDTTVAYLLGQNMAQSGQPEAARAYFMTCLTGNPGSLEAKLALAALPTALLIPVNQMTPLAGHAFEVALPETFDSANDLQVENRGERLYLFENETYLGPRATPLPEIQELGRGRYGHGPKKLFFSTSDNSDPRKNGRTYTLKFLAVH